MIKMTMFLKRKPSLTREEFVRHHIEVHGPLFNSIPEATKHVIHYIQTHPIANTADALTAPDFDGTAEIWFDSATGLKAVLGSQTYKEKVYPDETTFLDHEQTLTLLANPLETTAR